MAPSRSVFVSPSGAMRQERALAWLERHPGGAEVLVVGETQDVADHLAREGGRKRSVLTQVSCAGTHPAPPQ